MKKHAAVTICSINYLAKALVLFDSYIKQHDNHDFYLVIVDRKSSNIKINRANIKIIWVEDLGIPNFLKHAFTYDVIEFNTNIKPFALQLILQTHDCVVYLDPDIRLYFPLTSVFNQLQTSSVVVTPHSNTPILDGKKPDDLELLKFGGFNLGFIGVANCDEGFSFLSWWSERCLGHGFYEPQSGLAVDQKWVSIAPCFFPSMTILHDVGLNVAFWNLHERSLEIVNGHWMVNRSTPLKFIHFSSFDENCPGEIAKKQSRFLPNSRPDFSSLSFPYAVELTKNESVEYLKVHYSFDYFEDGTYITPALRRFYGELRFNIFSSDENPFSDDGAVMNFAKNYGLLTKRNGPSRRHTFRDLNNYQFQIKLINKVFRLALFVLGPERYFNFMRYLAHISSLRNQVQIFGNLH